MHKTETFDGLVRTSAFLIWLDCFKCIFSTDGVIPDHQTVALNKPVIVIIVVSKLFGQLYPDLALRCKKKPKTGGIFQAAGNCLICLDCLIHILQTDAIISDGETVAFGYLLCMHIFYNLPLGIFLI